MITPSVMKELNKLFKSPVSLICCLFNLLIYISHRGESRTLIVTKMKIFVEIFLFAVVTKTFVPDATAVLDQRDRL